VPGGRQELPRQGPSALPLRLLAPILVAGTAGIFVTGVWLARARHRSDQVLLLDKTVFVIWAWYSGSTSWPISQ
jgi:hypothetical protein